MKTIVYTFGVFDMLHIGHLAILEEAKTLGDELVVGIFRDSVVEGFKRKPIIPEEERERMVGGLRVVDETFLQEHLSPEAAVRTIEPAVVIKGPGAGYEDNIDKLREKFPKIRFILADYHEGQSTSAIINKIKNDNSI